MKAHLYIDDISIGHLNLEIADQLMGVLSGTLIPNENYGIFQSRILNNFDEKGISNISDFNYKIILQNGYVLSPAGGIGIIHSRAFMDEILIETAGNDLQDIQNNG